MFPQVTISAGVSNSAAPEFCFLYSLPISSPPKNLKQNLFREMTSIPLALSSWECDFASRTWRRKVNHDKMVKLDLRDSELRALSVSENYYSV
jgi:hypothetical protein